MPIRVSSVLITWPLVRAPYYVELFDGNLRANVAFGFPVVEPVCNLQELRLFSSVRSITG